MPGRNSPRNLANCSHKSFRGRSLFIYFLLFSFSCTPPSPSPPSLFYFIFFPASHPRFAARCHGNNFRWRHGDWRRNPWTPSFFVFFFQRRRALKTEITAGPRTTAVRVFCQFKKKNYNLPGVSVLLLFCLLVHKRANFPAFCQTHIILVGLKCEFANGGGEKTCPGRRRETSLVSHR